MAMGWTEYVLKDEEVLLKDERGTAKTEESKRACDSSVGCVFVGWGVKSQKCVKSQGV